MKKVLSIALVLAVGVVITGCSADSKPATTPAGKMTPATPSKM